MTFLILLFLSFTAHAGQSPIIYGQVAGVPCAYNLISRACVPTSGTSQWIDSASDIYFSAGKVMIGASSSDSSGAKLKVAGAAADDYIASFHGPSGTGSGLVFVTHAAATGTDLQGVTAVTLAAARPVNFNPSGGQVVLGSAIGTITLVGHASCTTLTTNASSVVGCTVSDENLKKDIVPFERGLEALKDIKPITFKFKDPADKGVEHTGFSAQNVEKSISEAVRIGSDGYRMIDYWAIIAAQTNAINELRARLEALEGPSVAKVKKAIPQKKIWIAPKPVPKPLPKAEKVK